MKRKDVIGLVIFVAIVGMVIAGSLLPSKPKLPAPSSSSTTSVYPDGTITERRNGDGSSTVTVNSDRGSATCTARLVDGHAVTSC